ncbi:hypothetical protein QYE76_043501 [Lolium multiflorum]|uniref:Uncharacterized protein n=1 Tax=Lolium multiflorum TaxID=4521 RepID=A0AAD8WY93_LOLMU|nr:hypothetical protein QYE76_043501 [Lolium multiflorum]
MPIANTESSPVVEASRRADSGRRCSTTNGDQASQHRVASVLAVVEPSRRADGGHWCSTTIGSVASSSTKVERALSALPSSALELASSVAHSLPLPATVPHQHQGLLTAPPLSLRGG